MEKGLGTDSFGIWTSIKQADLAQDKNALLTTPYPPWERGRGGGSPLLEWTVPVSGRLETGNSYCTVKNDEKTSDRLSMRMLFGFGVVVCSGMGRLLPKWLPNSSESDYPSAQTVKRCHFFFEEGKGKRPQKTRNFPRKVHAGSLHLRSR